MVVFVSAAREYAVNVGGCISAPYGGWPQSSTHTPRISARSLAAGAYPSAVRGKIRVSTSVCSVVEVRVSNWMKAYPGSGSRSASTSRPNG